MSTRVQGFALHYYNDVENSDKFYRAFIFEEGGTWTLASHWGRDGASGSIKVERSHAFNATAGLARKQREKLGKGYQLLGEGAITVDDDVLRDVRKISTRLYDWVDRPPVKLPTGYVFIIREEIDILDLIA